MVAAHLAGGRTRRNHALNFARGGGEVNLVVREQCGWWSLFHDLERLTHKMTCGAAEGLTAAEWELHKGRASVDMIRNEK
jgi:hypothetical protein